MPNRPASRPKSPQRQDPRNHVIDVEQTPAGEPTETSTEPRAKKSPSRDRTNRKSSTARPNSGTRDAS
jgi:hypothetical protein